MIINRAHPLLLITALAACPAPEGQQDTTATGTTTTDGPQDPTTTGESTDPPTTGAPTTDTPSTGDTSTGSTGTGDTTTDDTTTGGTVPVVTRVLYHPFFDHLGQPSASAARYVEIVDGVALPPVTILDPPGEQLNISDRTQDRPWSPYYSTANDPAQLWLVDMDTLTAHEIALPAEVGRVVTARVSRGDSHLIVWARPPGDKPALEDYVYYVCELGPAAQCTLDLVEAATGPTTYVANVAEISATSGRIWYTSREIGGPAQTVLQGDVAAPEAAVPLAEFPDGGGLSRISLDEKTAYFITAGIDQLQAMDISTDPPGSLVPLHPPQPGARWTWSEDDKDLLIYPNEDTWGDLFHLRVDGVEATPMVQINAGGPSHVRDGRYEWISDKRVLFIGDQESPGLGALYLADTAAPMAPPTKLSGPLEVGGKVNNAFMRGDPGHVVYFANLAAKAPNEMFRASIDAPGEVHKINGPLAPGSFLLNGAFSVSADGLRVVYGGEEVEGRTDLFLVDIDGETPGAPINLTSGLPADTEVSLLGYLTPDAAQVVFDTQLPDQEAGPLYMVPLSPTIGEPVRLSADGESIYAYSVLKAQ